MTLCCMCDGTFSGCTVVVNCLAVLFEGRKYSQPRTKRGITSRNYTDQANSASIDLCHYNSSFVRRGRRLQTDRPTDGGGGDTLPFLRVTVICRFPLASRRRGARSNQRLKSKFRGRDGGTTTVKGIKSAAVRHAQTGRQAMVRPREVGDFTLE